MTHQHCRTPVSPASSRLLWGNQVSLVSGHFHFSLSVSPLSNLSKIKHTVLLELPNSQNVSQQKVFPSLLLTCQNCPMAFLLSISFMPSILLAPCAFLENKNAPGSYVDGGFYWTPFKSLNAYPKKARVSFNVYSKHKLLKEDKLSCRSESR